MEVIRRLIAYILVLCLVVQNPICIYADTTGGGNEAGGQTWTPSPGGSNSNANCAVFTSYGYKVTITTPGGRLSDIQPLGDTYTIEELEQQFQQMDESLKKSYYEPGRYGIHAYATGVGRGNNFSISNGAAVPRAQTVRFLFGECEKKWMEVGNPLAWALYDRDVGAPFLYNEEIAYLFTAEGASACGDAMSWINEVNRLYGTIQVNNSGYTGKYPEQLVYGVREPIEIIKGLFESPAGYDVAAKFKHITWSTNVEALYGKDGEDPYVKALGARLGLVGLDALMCLAALRAGNQLTLNEMVNRTYAWITSDYATDNMAVIMVESTSAINRAGDINGDAEFMTLLDHMALTFGSQQILMGNWPDECINDTKKAIVWSTNGANTPVGMQGIFKQGIGGYPMGGTYEVGTRGSMLGRNYLKTLLPRNTDSLFGYFINWAYDAGGLNSTQVNNSMGSFTWQLNPDGVNDKTPSEEINASSTIYNLNIAQNGYNDNNYTTDWVPTVRQDGVDGNKLRIRIYHISENLTEDQQATEYARDAVKKQGKPVTTAV